MGRSARPLAVGDRAIGRLGEPPWFVTGTIERREPDGLLHLRWEDGPLERYQDPNGTLYPDTPAVRLWVRQFFWVRALEVRVLAEAERSGIPEQMRSLDGDLRPSGLVLMPSWPLLVAAKAQMRSLYAKMERIPLRPADEG